MKNCVVRTFNESYMNSTSRLFDKLKDGWIVKMGTPYVGKSGETIMIEYILEKEE